MTSGLGRFRLHTTQRHTDRLDDHGRPQVGGAREHVVGIGGVFFRSRDPQGLAAWYEQHLGVPSGNEPWQQEAGPTVWAPFPRDSEYLGGPEQHVMINFRVRNLDAMLAQLHEAGVDPDDEVVEEAGIGRFAHVRDPAGTRIELWEPPDDQ
jgi:catechol 2,3-dioxygenase-like lactoylglutathione lyase family enzyme